MAKSTLGFLTIRSLIAIQGPIHAILESLKRIGFRATDMNEETYARALNLVKVDTTKVMQEYPVSYYWDQNQDIKKPIAFKDASISLFDDVIIITNEYSLKYRIKTEEVLRIYHESHGSQSAYSILKILERGGICHTLLIPGSVLKLLAELSAIDILSLK